MDKSHREKVCALALNRIFGYRPAISLRLLETLGSAAGVFDLDRDGLRDVFGPYGNDCNRISKAELERSEKELEALETQGIRFISISESCYPANLKECPDAPVGLYVRSLSPPDEIFNRRPSVAVVGTRDLSPYGAEWCNRIVAALSETECGPTVVSGLALGTDITAHMSALGHSLPTVAVLPTGITSVYPWTHRVAAGKIAAAPGSALITDFPPDTTPRACTFIRRNRIIAGMTDATILIESREKGGGLITARLASGYGRPVFVLPGRVDDVRSAGCNHLLHEKIAEPITSAGMLVHDLGFGNLPLHKAVRIETVIHSKYGGSPDEDALMRMARIVKAHRGISVEEACREAGLGYAEGSAAAGALENDGIISIDLLRRCTINPKID